MKDIWERLISFEYAVKAYYAITAFAVFYHILILTQVVDYKNAWGGRLDSIDQMYQYEALSIILQILFAGAIFIKQYSVKVGRSSNGLTALLLIITLVYLLNTAGNIFAISIFEKVIFTPLTLIVAFATLRIAFEKPEKPTQAS